MTIPRMSVATLGVGDLQRSTDFYRLVFGMSPYGKFAHDIAFFELPGAWLALYARSVEDVQAIFIEARKARACVVQVPRETFWGGFAGYFSDPDGYVWEVALGSMFAFAEDRSLRFAE